MGGSGGNSDSRCGARGIQRGLRAEAGFESQPTLHLVWLKLDSVSALVKQAGAEVPV